MKEMKWIACLTAAALGAGILCSCGDSGRESTAEMSDAVQTSETTAALPDGTTYATVTLAEGVTTKMAAATEAVQGTTTKKGAGSYMQGKRLTAPKVTITTTKPAARPMGINLNSEGANIHFDTDWTPLTDHDRNTDTYIVLTSFPAILQYKSPLSTCTVVMEEGCETEKAFAANTKESYIEAFGSQFDSIEISSFEFIKIDSIDSIKVTGSVISDSAEFEMAHIISNCTYKEKTISYMLLDADGNLTDMFADFEECISYTMMFNGKIGEITDRVNKRRQEMMDRINGESDQPLYTYKFDY